MMNGQMELLRILNGDALTQLKTLPDESVQCCVTSPPYWGLRNYGVDGQLGLEDTPGNYVGRLVEILREVRRTLRKDGTLWLNLGDSYCAAPKGNLNGQDKSGLGSTTTQKQSPCGFDKRVVNPNSIQAGHTSSCLGAIGARRGRVADIKPKDLVGIPWMVAFALREDGWYLRSEITWCKKVPMPESVEDRPTSATEKIFLLTKSARYYYDADAVRNPPSEAYANDPRWRTGSTDRNEKNGYAESGAQNPKAVHRVFDKQRGHSRRHAGFNDRWDAMPRAEQCANGSNMLNYWLLGPEPYSESHFATFPSEVPKRCILAGSKPGDLILDPFAGSGTTGMVALELGSGSVWTGAQKRLDNLVERSSYARSAKIFAFGAFYFFYLAIGQGAQFSYSVGESVSAGLIKVGRDFGCFTVNFEKSFGEYINVGLSNNARSFGTDTSDKAHELDLATPFRGFLRVAATPAFTPNGKQMSNGGSDNGDQGSAPKTNSWRCFAWHGCLFVLGAMCGTLAYFAALFIAERLFRPSPKRDRKRLLPLPE
jgi:DNA modification methylase